MPEGMALDELAPRTLIAAESGLTLRTRVALWPGLAFSPQRLRLVDRFDAGFLRLEDFLRLVGFLRVVDRFDAGFLRLEDFLRLVGFLRVVDRFDADFFFRLVDFFDDFEPRPPAWAARFFTDSPISPARSTALSTTTPTTLCPTSVLSAFLPSSLPPCATFLTTGI
jgi:hypothetical protein